MDIREAQLEDIETLFKIRTSVVENYLSRQELANLDITPATVAIMLQTDCCAWVAEIDEKLIGFSIADAAQTTVFALFILPAYEGRGVGRALIEKAEQWLWSLGFTEIWLLTTNNPKLRAYGFYQHLGWIPNDVQPDGLIKFIKSKRTERVL